MRKVDIYMVEVRINETVLRDAHQSLMATRMSTEDMLPIIEKMDSAGYYALECWGVQLMTQRFVS